TAPTGGSSRAAVSARGQVVVHLVDAHRGLLRDPGVARDRPDLVGRELVELLARAPHVGDSDPVVGAGDPVEQATGRARAFVGEPHPVHHLVVLLEGAPLEIHHHCDRHVSLLWLGFEAETTLRCSPTAPPPRIGQTAQLLSAPVIWAVWPMHPAW